MACSITMTKRKEIVFNERNEVEEFKKDECYLHVITNTDQYTIDLTDFEITDPHKVLTTLAENVKSLNDDLIIGYFTYCRQCHQFIPIKDFLNSKPRKIGDEDSENLSQILKDHNFEESQINFLFDYILDDIHINYSDIVDKYVKKNNKITWLADEDDSGLGYIYYLEESHNDSN